MTFVQAKNVYPQLLLGRLFFSVGGAAVSTMVTAVLPAVTKKSCTQAHRTSMASEVTITPNRYKSNQLGHDEHSEMESSSSRLAGFAGMFAGCGALVSLAVFLPLPAQFENRGVSPALALQYSYYIVAGVSFVVGIWCFFGLRNLPGEEAKGWKSLVSGSQHHSPDTADQIHNDETPQLPYWKQLSVAVALGFRNRNIGLGYLGGLVARASSVGISLFVPLSVNHYYRVSGLCERDRKTAPGGIGDIKRSCPKAYVLASILTGVSQLVALIAAPGFGFTSDKSKRFHLPLIIAALAGLAGYIAFALLPSPQYKGENGNPGVFVVTALIGTSQIGAIVCSLGVLSKGILKVDASPEVVEQSPSPEFVAVIQSDNENTPARGGPGEPDERHSLLHGPRSYKFHRLSHLKGSIAGVYSLCGGVGILILTKLGGQLFDQVSTGSPFFIMAGFNGLLFLMIILSGLMTKISPTRSQVAP